MLKYLSIVLSAILIKCDGKLPPNIKVCSRNDPNLAKCIIESVTILQPRLGDGNLGPGFNIPPLDPIKLDNLIIDRGQNLQVYVTNLNIEKGASGFKIDKLKVNLNEPTFDILISLPQMEFHGKYNIKTKIALVLIQGQGELVGIADNYKARIRLVGRKYLKNGKTFVHFDKLQMKILAGQTKFELKNLFDNNPAIKTIGTAIVNENSQYFVSEIIPSLERHLTETYSKTANELIKDISYDEMFPDV